MRLSPQRSKEKHISTQVKFRRHFSSYFRKVFHVKKKEEKEKRSMILNQGDNGHVLKKEDEKDGPYSLKSTVSLRHKEMILTGERIQEIKNSRKSP